MVMPMPSISLYNHGTDSEKNFGGNIHEAPPEYVRREAELSQIFQPK